ncbi:hypothetical protein DPMN_003946 [Dreissena polymorpha]|uniref:Uncharacterized protein n=1 Tax=Dreissena polymorpha TaxID=45954 RepID=A0A9D4RT42_DREPO|nr:hypothetical protein DPMN_003946 [Dreissena polymorpha]
MTIFTPIHFQGSTAAGKFSISTVNLLAGGVLEMLGEIRYQLVLSSLTVYPSGTIQAADLLIETKDANIQEGGVINLSERGFKEGGDGWWF